MFSLANDPTPWEQDFGDFLGNLLRDKYFVSETTSGKPTKQCLPQSKEKLGEPEPIALGTTTAQVAEETA